MQKLVWVLGIATVASLFTLGWIRQETEALAKKEFHLTMFVGSKEGYILIPPEFVAQPFIRRIEWSPDGRYAALVQTALRVDTPTQPESFQMRHRLLVWNRQTRRLSVLWESVPTQVDINPSQDVQIAFYKATPACLLAIREGRLVSDADQWSVYHARLGGRTVRLGQFSHVVLLAPPEDTARYLLWTESLILDDTPAFYGEVSSTGALGESRLLPPVMRNALVQAMPSRVDHQLWLWDATGKSVIAVDLEPLPAKPEERAAQQFSIRHFLWDPRTNQAQAVSRNALRFYEHRLPDLSIETKDLRAELRGKADTTQTLWLREGEGVGLVAADSALAQVSPTGDAILYVAHGAAFYRTLFRLPIEEARRLQESAQAEQYLSQGKQIALAFMMYVQDYDEMFPPNVGDEHVAEVLLPYLRDWNPFQVDGVFAFRYALDVKPLGEIESPADTVVGYLQLSGGRVVIYADGHVQWERNK
ncbi:MAG: hypothetical protein KatS3mg019_1856 [Fimbriimonadales bacterium]|nr:MAG: hypothetical protein KatS3mg019_1856 [Fimbriimonadales bacterium]